MHLLDELELHVSTLAWKCKHIFLVQLHAWFLREKEDANRARNLWRILVNNSPDRVVFAFTGGSMCSVGGNVSEGGAATSEAIVPYDIGKLLRISRCSMPASISDAAAAETWAHMQVVYYCHYDHHYKHSH